MMLMLISVAFKEPKDKYHKYSVEKYAYIDSLNMASAEKANVLCYDIVE